jgi:putative holliday junction resolvase
MTGLLSLPVFAATLTPRSRLMALDLGTHTIGLAIASWPGGIATPLGTIRRSAFTADATDLMARVAAEGITHIILGLPYHMGGAEGSRAQSTRAFARNLQRFAPPPILLHDERLTTSEADDRMREAGLKANRRADMIDAAAAAVILDSAMRSLSLVHRQDARLEKES